MVLVSHLVHYDTLLQNMTDIITKYDSCFFYKMRQEFIRKRVSFFTPKCGSFITKCNSYYKLQQLYYKMRRLLQIATVQTNIKEIPYNSNSLQIREIYCSKSRKAKERNIANQKRKTRSKKLMLKKTKFHKMF